MGFIILAEKSKKIVSSNTKKKQIQYDDNKCSNPLVLLREAYYWQVVLLKPENCNCLFILAVYTWI